ncbi:MAG: 4Fe-4S binding protein [Planctomycetota bacterium]|nr:4Fe-4S binding protein [Planctomycetota bacterium]MDE2217672.1 4Fe-4S binding protein [Planctomycetota bacterium]
MEEVKQQYSTSTSVQEIHRENKQSDAGKIIKSKRGKFNSQRLRWSIQIAFLVVILVIGWQFYTFVKYCEAGGKGFYMPRPPGVESFLPISALMGTKYFFGTGKINPIHPAGFVIFGTLLLTALFFRRGFCGWICPVGTISEWEWRFGDWFLKKLPQRFSYVMRNIPTRLTAGLSLIFTPIVALLVVGVLTMDSFKSPVFMYLTPAYILAMALPFVVPRRFWSDKVNDRIARAWKFAILAFFIQVIIIKMPISQLEVMYTRVPFIRVADVKMLKFFTNMSGMALSAILIILIFSLVNKNFWCRFFCPYGALLGIIAYASPMKIVRDTRKCIDCGKCTRACAMHILVEKKKHVLTHECVACYDCVNACPVNGALDMKLVGDRKKIHYGLYALMLVGLYVAITNTARATGHWYTKINDAEYILRISELNQTKYLHKAGQFETE